jgi:hypothetical protein
MVNFKFAKFHCYQQIQSFLITPYYHFECCKSTQINTIQKCVLVYVD